METTFKKNTEKKEDIIVLENIKKEDLTKENIKNTKDEDQVKEKIKKSALEKAKQKISIINVEEIAENEAHKAADDAMTESKSKAGFFKNLWKHTFFDEIYRQKEVNKAREEIKKSGDVYTGRRSVIDKVAHDTTMKAVSDLFVSDYEGTLTDGEEKKLLDEKDPEAVQAKTDIKNLLDGYAMSKINDATFEIEKNKIIKNLKNEDLLRGANTFADNLFEIAQNARLAIEHGAKMEELDSNLEILVGKAKSSLKTEAHFNLVDKGVDKMKKSKIGRYLSPAVLSTGIGLAYSLSVGLGSKVAGSKAGAIIGGVGTLGISVGLSTAIAGMNESQRIALDKKQRDIEAAEGGITEKGDKRREQLDKFAYQMESSKNLAQNLRNLMFDKDKNGEDVIKDLQDGDAQKIMASIAEIDARKSLNVSKKIDLISYSGVDEVEKESTDLTILTAKAKVELNKKIINGLKSGIPNDKTFEEYLAEQVKTVEGTLLGGEKGINSQDRAFSRHKAWRVTKKMAATATIGFLIGGTIQEFAAHFRGSVQGMFENATNADGSHATMQTPFRHIIEWISGNQTHMNAEYSLPFDFHGNHLNLPPGVSLINNVDGTCDLLRGDQVISSHFLPTFDTNGGLDATSIARLGQDGIIATVDHQIIDSTKEVTSNVQDWIHNHPGETINVQHVHDAPFMDQNTSMVPDPTNAGHMVGADGNEILTQWGGLNGTGINSNGDAVLNISHMTSVDSFHGDISVNVPEEMHNGSLMAIIYLDSAGSAAGEGIPVPIGSDGNIIFDHNNPIMQQIFRPDANGQMVSHAKVIEIVQKMGIGPNGDQQIRALGALVGEGLDKIKEIIPFHQDIAVNTLAPTLPTELPMFVPLVARRPLGPVVYGEKEKAKENKSENVKEKTEKETAIELSQEEYDAMKDDLKMLNSKIMTSAGIITLTKESFKSEYGKKRYLDLKSIPAGKSKEFNRTETELQKIGNEIEGILSKAKVISKEELAKRLEKENKNKTIEIDLRSDLEMLNKTLSGSKGIITLDESSFMSDFGKEKYKKLKSIPKGKNFEFNRDELGKIGDEMAKYLSNYQSIGKTKTNEVVTENNPVIKTEEKIKENKNSDTEIKKSNTKIDSKKEETKINNLELNKNNIEVNKILSKEALTKIGTKFVSKEGEYIITKISKGGGFMGMFSKTNIEVIYKNSKGVETLITYNKNDLEKELEKGNIQIIKNENNKKTTENNIDEKDADFELNKFINQISLLLLDATDEHLSKEPELKIFAVKAYPTIINDFKKDFGSMNKKEEEETMEEFTTICKDKKKFIEAMKKFQKSGVLV